MNERSYERNKNTMDIKTTSPIDKGSILSISKLFKVISDPTRLSVLFLFNSVSIMSDAVHDLGDSISIGFAWFFQGYSEKKQDERFTLAITAFTGRADNWRCA
ncbi:hypothetical protein GCM10025861_27760 (plasmid) [Methanobacterium petrolearium]|nr:hypothetical protein GCM10025861_27760 [Methanobacterium petrolearium]